jgi:hypothetical protein
MEHINKMDSKLWIIGDSFADIRHENDSWQIILYKAFVGDKIYVSSDGSRDIQTIIDIFLKNLHKIKENDFVILILPSTVRFRLPLENQNIDNTYGENNEDHYKSLFIGNGRYSFFKQLEISKNDNHHNFEKYNNTKIEYPLSEINPDLFHIPNKKWNPYAFSSILATINSSKASITNYNQILNSFKKYFAFKIELYSWIDELDESIVQTKKIITNKCGLWHTENDDFIETNEQFGLKGDSHWSKKMDKEFANMIIKENPKLFNQNLI